jgi:anti-sigma regulatory factor (Ser/Thr protein kinase)
VRDVLNGWRMRDGEEPVLLCTDELVTNAIVHVSSDIELVVRHGEGVIRVEVHDRSSKPPLRRVPPMDAESGRGLQLVEALSSRWGVEAQGEGAGKAVWFEVAESAAAASQ